MRYTGPKNRIARGQQADLGLKTTGSKAHATLLKKVNIKPGQHGARYRRKVSEHAKQLIEKQKLRHIFGLTETALKKYFEVSSRKKGNTAVHLCEVLERRLDNVLYRMGFAPTRASARQLVSHGHVLINNKKMDIPSYLLRNGDEVTYKNKKTKEIPYLQAFQEQSDIIIPGWLVVKKDSGKMATTPDDSLIKEQVNLRLVIEFYSR